jgi:GNAT superfamily N-acetyltransferase
MFVSTDLAARIDGAESRLTEGLGRTARAGSQPEAFVARWGGGVAVCIESSSPANKIIGVGFGPLPDDAWLDAVEGEFSARDAAPRAEVATLADPAFAERLTRRGYVLHGYENVLGQRLSPGATAVKDGFDIREWDGDLREWIDAAVTGFLHPDDQGIPPDRLPGAEETTRLLSDLMQAPGYVRYGAWVDGRLAGVASFRCDDGLGLLTGATTLPQFRGRGVQTALLRRRLADARAAGCELALMTVQPGSKSQENGQRQGFSLLYSRAVLVRP